MFPFYVQHFYRKNTTQAECHILADPYIFLTELQLVQKKKFLLAYTTKVKSAHWLADSEVISECYSSPSSRRDKIACQQSNIWQKKTDFFLFQCDVQ